MKTRSAALLVAGMLATAACLGGAADAAQSVFSTVREVRAPTRAPGAPGPRLSIDAAQEIFSIVVSVHGNPSGDGKPDNDLPGEEQKKYEDVIRNFADALCEESNGAHRLGEVRIFRRGEQSGRADIIWNAREWPRAPLSGHRANGLGIIFGDVFPNGNGPGSDKDMLGDPIGAGYTLAHEWGHYAYGLYDEYKGNTFYSLNRGTPRSSDTPVVPAIMNSQWNAVNGDFDWLNHSTRNNYQANTAQGRIYGKSCWDVLVQSAADDPILLLFTTRYHRKKWVGLDGAEPTAADNWIKRELPGKRATCRADLKIVWVDNLEMQIVIDRSGSMSGSPLDAAKQAAQSLVGVVPDGKSALGVVAFDDSVSQVVPITPIPDPGAATKASINGVIAGISSGAATAIYDAAILALENLSAFRTAQTTTASQVVFLLTDGDDNSSVFSSSEVVAAYKTANVPLITFGYGSFAPTGVLRDLATATGGLFFSSPTTLAQIQAAFLAATAAVGASTSVASGSPSATPGGTAVQSFVVDGTLASFTALVNFVGSPADVTLALVGPAGPDPTPFSCTAASGQTSCTAQVSAAAVGAWSVRATNHTAATLDVNVDVVATPKSGRTYELTVDAGGGSSVVGYPTPIAVTAVPSQGLPITGVNLTASVTDPGGTTTPLVMNDAGVDGDGVPGDGIYSALLGYTMDGLYTVTVRVDNAGLGAIFTTAGLQPSLGANGEMPDPAPLPPITENFTRSATAQVTVSGTASDDHPDAPPGTPMTADNVAVPGNVDFAGDEDWFSIRGIDPTAPLTVRVAETAFGMNPALTVLRSDGTTVVATATLDTARSRNGYLVLVVDPASLDPSGTMQARVTHVDPAAAMGTYEISAGPAIYGDGPPQLDSYKCYDVKGKAKKHTVGLVDALESKTTDVRRPLRLCSPADADGSGIDDAAGQLACYRIRDARKPRQPKFKRTRLALQNRFGAVALRVLAPETLCLPSVSDLAATTPLDAYKCYQARGKAARAKLGVSDAFESKQTLVLKPRLLCAPADMDGSGVGNPTSRLVCYAIKDARTKPRQKKFKRQRLAVVNAFGQQALRVNTPRLLCVPSMP
jgi:calcium-activated chloride channel regulator 4